MGKKFLRRKLGELVEVSWLDAVGEADGWVSPILFEYEQHEADTPCKSVGYFMNQTKEHIFIAQLTRSSDNGMARVLSIPIRSITRIVRR